MITNSYHWEAMDRHDAYHRYHNLVFPIEFPLSIKVHKNGLIFS